MPIISKEIDMEDYVTFEQAKKLKELGFDWECNHWYHPADKLLYESGGGFYNHNESKMVCSAPTLSQTQKWLREKGYHIQITPNMTWRGWRILLYIKNGSPEIYDSYEGYKFDTYEQALSVGIDRALEFLK